MMFVSGINYTYMGTARLATLIKKRQTGIANFKDFDENRAAWSSTVLLPTNKKKRKTISKIIPKRFCRRFLAILLRRRKALTKLHRRPLEKQIKPKKYMVTSLTYQKWKQREENKNF